MGRPDPGCLCQVSAFRGFLLALKQTAVSTAQESWLFEMVQALILPYLHICSPAAGSQALQSAHAACQVRSPPPPKPPCAPHQSTFVPSSLPCSLPLLQTCEMGSYIALLLRGKGDRAGPAVYRLAWLQCPLYLLSLRPGTEKLPIAFSCSL